MNNRIFTVGFFYSFLILILTGCSGLKNNELDDIESRIDEIISQMTLEEKVGMIHGNSAFTSGGVERLGITEWVFSDGPHGVRREYNRDWTLAHGVDDAATYLPTGIALAATWNEKLAYEFGAVLGNEAKYRGKDVILGPGVNIIRTPLNGRNFEYFSEDPYLTSRVAVNYIKGVQDQDIAACVKHYAANNQESERTSVNVEMSERALREIYLPAFKAAVEEAEVQTVMGAYNKFRGQQATHNEYLINNILKGEFGFKGVVVSDWSAVQNTMEALLYGTDVEMGTDLLMRPNVDFGKFFMADTVLTLVNEGIVDESVVDDKVRRILRVRLKTKLFDERSPGAFNTKEHQVKALEIAEESIVLLKNNNLLPLNKGSISTIAVIGDNATRKHANKGGSSQVKAKYEITPMEGLQKITDGKVELKHAQGYQVNRDFKVDEKMIKDAAKIASESDIAVIFCGYFHAFSEEWEDHAYDAEDVDKPDIFLPFGQDFLINAVLDANPNTVVVLIGGGPVDMTSWIENVPAIVQAWYPGMEGGNAIANILFGNINPSGKLPVTFPKKLMDCPAHALGEYPGKDGTVQYKDDIFVGYRYFDTFSVDPLFPFGHGLSYTSFKYSGLTISENNETISVRLNLKNIGEVIGGEVIQLYINDEIPDVMKPAKELKAFKKVFLKPNESANIEIMLDRDDFKYFDEDMNKWRLSKGVYNILVGSSSRDIRLSESIKF